MAYGEEEFLIYAEETGEDTTPQGAYLQPGGVGGLTTFRTELAGASSAAIETDDSLAVIG